MKGKWVLVIASLVGSFSILLPAKAQVYPLSSLPLLSSRPSASATLVLDLDGDIQLNYGGPGITITTPAYDIDGDPTTFSATELYNIQRIWARVAEDYAPYNINVTTIDTGNLTDYVTSKIIIGGDGLWAGGGPGGGVAGGGAFTNGNIRNTGFAFGQGQGVYIGNVASHEAGHTFGLGHQQTWDPATGLMTAEYANGTANWGPIMGGPWGNFIVWDNGTCGGVDRHQNDMEALGSRNLASDGRGFTFASDRAGGYRETAAPMAVNPAGAITQTGIIGMGNDVDYYKFTTTAGTRTFNIQPTTWDATDTSAYNVIPTLEIRDTNGTLIKTVSANQSAIATISQSLAAGTYYLVVKSNGSYGYAGTYALTGTLAGATPTVTWDGNTSTTGLQEGAGTWNTTDTNRWYNGSTYQAWSNSTPVNAVFGQDVDPAATSQAVTLAGATTVNSLTFNEGAKYTISGGSLTLASGGQIINNFTTTIASNITLAGAGSIISNWPTLTLSGTVNNGGYTLSIGGAKDTVIGGVISGSGGLSKFEPGILTLNATNTYSGPTTIAGGILRAAQGVGLPSTNLVLGGGSLETSGSFTRSLGTGASQVQFTSGDAPSGFSARGGALTVNVNNNGSTLVWGSANFNPNGLMLNADTADSALTLTNGLDLAGAPRVFYVGANTATINGLLIGSAGSSIVKQGAGTLMLTQGASLGTGGPMTIVSGTVNTNGHDLTVTSLLMGGNATGTTSTLNLGSAKLTLAGNVTYDAWSNNGATITAGTIDVGATTPTFYIEDNGANSLNLTGSIIGTGGLIKDGFGSLALGNNSFTGAVTVNKGYIQMNSANAFGTTAAGTTFNGGGITALQSTSESFTIAGSVTFNNWGGSPVLSGPIAVNAGATLTFATGGGNYMSINGPLSGGGDIHLSHNPTWAPIQIAGTGPNTLTGSWVLDSGGIKLNKPAGVDAIAGPVLIGTISQGYLTWNASNQVNDATVISLQGQGTSRASYLQLNGNSDTIAGLTSVNVGDGYVENNHTSALSTLTVKPVLAGDSYTFSGFMRNGSNGKLALTKDGAGTFVLAGTNTYTGPTIVNGGTLTLTGSLDAGSTVTVNNGSTLGGTGTAGGVVTLNATGHLAPGLNATTSGTLTAGGLTTAGAQLDWLLGSTTNSDKLQLNTGALTATGLSAFNFTTMAGFGAGTYVLIDYGTFAGSLANFTVPANIGNLNLSLLDTGTSINLKVLSAAGEWALATGGNWNDAASWTAAVPNAIDGEANFLDNLAAPDTVNLNTAITVGSIRFNNANRYTIAGTNSLTLNTSGANASIYTSVGSHTIASPVILAKSVDVTVGLADQTLTFSGNISGSAKGMNLLGPGTVLLSGNNTFTGGLAVNGGTLKVSGGNAIGNTTDVTVAAGATFDVNGSDETIGALIPGGTINVNAGTLRITKASTVSGLTGSGTVYKTGTGVLTLQSNSGYTGDFNITGDPAIPTENLVVGSNSPFGDTVGTTTLNGVYIGGLQSMAENFFITGGTTTFGNYGGDPTLTGTLTVNSGATLKLNTGGGNHQTVNGPLAGVGTVRVQHNTGGWAPMTFAGTAGSTLTGSFILEKGGIEMAKPAGVNALSGAITVGTTGQSYITWKANDQISDASVITISENTSYLQLAGYSDTIGGLVSTLTGAAVQNNSPSYVSTLTVNVSGFNSYTYAGLLRDGSTQDLNLIKAGTGTQVLSGTNTYTGTTAITGGKLSIAADANLGTAPGSLVANQLKIDGGSLLATANVTLAANRGLTFTGTGGGLEASSAYTLTVPSPVVGSSWTKTGTGTVNFTGTQTYASPSTLTITDGTVKFSYAAASEDKPNLAVSIASGKTFNIAAGDHGVGNITGSGITTVAASAKLTANYVRGSNLTLGAGAIAKIRSNGTDAAYSKLATLTLSGSTGAWTSKLDLTNNDLILTGGTIATVLDQVKSGYAGGAWTGNGITTSTGVAGQGLGVDTAANLGLATFAGQTVATTDILVKYTWLGDADFNGVVDFSDFLKLQAGYGKAAQTWANGDFNYDGGVDFSDFLLLQAAYGKPALSETVAPVSVPEPATLSLLALGGLALLRRNKK